MFKKALIVGVAYACLFLLIAFFVVTFDEMGLIWFFVIILMFSPASITPPVWIIVLILTSIIIMAIILIRILKNSTIKEAALMCLVTLSASVITVILMYGSLSFLPELWPGWNIGTIVRLVLATQPILFFAIILTLIYLAIRKLWINYVQKH